MKKRLPKSEVPREQQRQVVLTSEHYLKGEEFNRNDIYPLLGLTPDGAAHVLKSMADDGLLRRRLVKSRNRQYIFYCKPSPSLIRKAWRKLTDHQIGIEPCPSTGV